MSSSLRVLILSHDNNGISKTARSMQIARHLAKHVEESSTLILTDLSIIGKFKFPQNVDFVHLPGIHFRSNSDFRASNLNIQNQKTLKIRRKIAQSTAKTFKPHLVLVEGDPAKLPIEMQRTLTYVRDTLPDVKIVWGLPDILGDTSRGRKVWSDDSVKDMFGRVVDEIWIYGCADMYDQIQKYSLPVEIARKIVYTGYLKYDRLQSERLPSDLLKRKLKPPFVFVNAGSGQMAYALIDTYLRYLERVNAEPEFQSLIVTGPMISRRAKKQLRERAGKLRNVVLHRFSKRIQQYVRHADLIVSTAGYNSICEILSFQKKALLVPSHDVDGDHLARASLLEKHGSMPMISPADLSPERIGEMICAMRSTAPDLSVTKNRDQIRMDGLEEIVRRVRSLTNTAVVDLQRAV